MQENLLNISTDSKIPLSLQDYARELQKSGIKVIVSSNDIFWNASEFGSMMRMPTFEVGSPTPSELQDVFQKGHPAVVSYLMQRDVNYKANAWLYVCRNKHYRLDDLPPPMRRNVRRGMKELKVEPLTLEQLLAYGGQAYCDTRNRVGLSDGTLKAFRRRFISRANCPAHVFLGAWKGHELAGFLSIGEVDNWVEIEGAFSRNDLLKYRPNDTMMYCALSRYLKERQYRLVSYGLSSIQSESHGDSLHAFKKKVGFEAIPVRRMFVLHPFLRPFANRFTLFAIHTALRLRPSNRLLKKAEGVLSCILGKNEGIIEIDKERQLLKGELQEWKTTRE